MQYLLNFPREKPVTPPNQRAIRVALRRAALKWLSDQGVGTEGTQHLALGVDVPIRGTALHADVAAVWLDYRRARLDEGGVSAILVPVPVRSAIVICAGQRADCWPECSDAERLIGEIATLRRRLAEVERDIRRDEPHLRDPNVLFEEYAQWNYAASGNQAYHELRHNLSHLESTLYRGSRLARLSNAQAASQLFLAFPRGVLREEEVQGSWGLLEVDTETLDTDLINDAQPLDSPPELQSALALAIAEASSRQVADCLGLRLNDGRPADVLRLPRFRRTAIQQPPPPSGPRP